MLVILFQEKREKTKASRANRQCEKWTGNIQESLRRLKEEKSSSRRQSKRDETFA